MNVVGVKYVGLKARKEDNVAGTGLFWTQGQIHAVPASLVPKFQKHPDVWEIVPITDDNVQDVGLVVDTLGTTQSELDQSVIDAAVEAQRQSDVAEAEKVADVEKTIEHELTNPTLPASFDSMTKSDIAAFAKRSYGVDFDYRTMTKESLVDAVRNTHNGRVTL